MFGPMSGADQVVAALAADGSTRWATNLEGAEAGAVTATRSGGVMVTLTCDTACDFGAGPIDTSEGTPLVLVELDGRQRAERALRSGLATRTATRSPSTPRGRSSWPACWPNP